MLIPLILALIEVFGLKSFGVIGDTQGRYHILKSAVADMRRRQVDFGVHVGDLADCNSYKRWRYVRNIMRTLHRPWKLTIGNHELTNCAWKTRQRYRKLYQRFWKTEPYYSYQVGPWTFVHLDTATPAIKGHQLDWFKGVITRARRVVLFTHRTLPCRHCMRLMGWKWRRMDPLRFKWRNRTLWHLLQKNRGKVHGVFHGHWHKFEDYVVDGLRVWCTGGGGGTLAKGGYFHYLYVRLYWSRLDVRVVRLKDKR